MSFDGEEYAVKKNFVDMKTKTRHLTGDICVQTRGAIEKGVTFEIPADVTEVRLSHDGMTWYLDEEHTSRSWRCGLPVEA